jgi:DNA modification methylase
LIMDLQEFSQKFAQIKAQGWVPSQRRGPTGIGHTFEHLLGLTENNIALPDLGKIEIKAHRIGATSLITLFTFNRNAWRISPLLAVKKYGTPDSRGRLGLYFALAKIGFPGFLSRSRNYSMRENIQLSFLEQQDDWTFQGASTRELTHCYHDYPARMIPQVAGKLLDLFGQQARLLFDPYCGSGTSLVEANLRGIDAIGTDLNPLAQLIAKAKTATPALDQVEAYVRLFQQQILEEKLHYLRESQRIYGIPRLEFWFKPEVVEKLLAVRRFIETIAEEGTRLFFQVAFSETVRESSNTRNDEFKLYRYDEAELERFNPDVYGIMASKLSRNLEGYRKYRALLTRLPRLPRTSVYDFNTVEGIPADVLPPQSVDIVITSPPYGDSGTTVAYGQYSRLSAAWLGLPDPHKIDRKLMGGQVRKGIPLFPSPELNSAIELVKTADEKRAYEVASFYTDLYASIVNVATVIRPNGLACYVVGNRKVRGVTLPTHLVACQFCTCTLYLWRRVLSLEVSKWTSVILFG